MPNLRVILARFFLITAFFILFSGTMLTALTKRPSPDPKLRAPWLQGRPIAQASPHDRAAVWTDGSTDLLAWFGEPNASGLSILDLTHDHGPTTLRLGTVPRQLSLYAAGANRWQMFWLDQPLPGETHLMGALIARNESGYKLERGPTDISNRRVVSYGASPLLTGEIALLWTEALPGSSQTPVNLQVVDGRGRPRPARQLSDSGEFPAAASDINGILHLAWLEGTAPAFRVVRYVSMAGNHATTQDKLNSDQVAVVPLPDGQYLESFVLGVDAGTVYCLWETVRPVGALTGILAGVTFPVGDAWTAHPITVRIPEESSGPGTLGLRWPAVAPQAGPGLVIGLTATTTNPEHAGQEFPLAVRLLPDGGVTSWPVTEAGTALISQIAVASASSGHLVLVWSALDRSGLATLFASSMAMPK